jgi:hypothetical protein
VNAPDRSNLPSTLPVGTQVVSLAEVKGPSGNAAHPSGAGHVFHQSANGVWLTARVPADYLEFAS